MAAPRIFIINVGVNASHGSLRSPLYDDGTFAFVPIPEGDGYQRFDCLPRYRDILPRRALACIPPQLHDLRAHSDPEFETFTYGDYPWGRGKAGVLKHVREGDHLLFLARLVRWHEAERRWGEPGFYIVGSIVVERILWELNSETPKSACRGLSGNAHVRRLATPLGEEGTSVFRGSAESRLFTEPLPFDRKLADRVMRDSDGDRWRWDPSRSDLQVIGSYTRSVRMIDDPRRARVLIEAVEGQP